MGCSCRSGLFAVVDVEAAVEVDTSRRGGGDADAGAGRRRPLPKAVSLTLGLFEDGLAEGDVDGRDDADEALRRERLGGRGEAPEELPDQLGGIVGLGQSPVRAEECCRPDAEPASAQLVTVSDKATSLGAAGSLRAGQAPCRALRESEVRPAAEAFRMRRSRWDTEVSLWDG